MKKLTEDQFERGYAKRSGISLKRLHELGKFAVPCDCGVGGCQGWVMVTRATLKDHVSLYFRD